MWLDEYDDSTFEQQLENIFEEIRPLYQQLHAYVRHALRAKFGDLVSETGPIPMHLLGNMWAQSWDSVSLKLNIYHSYAIYVYVDEFLSFFFSLKVFRYTAPYPDKKSTDVTDEMIKQNITPLKMFQMGDEFFQSLNMTKLPE